MIRIEGTSRCSHGKTMIRVLWVMSLFVLCSTAYPGKVLAQGSGRSADIIASEKRLALVVGNGAYDFSPLKNPVNDAKDMAVVLRRLGFQVIHKENADKREFVNAIQEFGRQLRSYEVGLFFFAGHGIQVGGRNYLIPVGAKVVTESEVEFEAVDAGRVLGFMEDAGNRVNIVMLDACRDNPFVRNFRSSTRGLARMDAPVGSFVAFATAPGSTAADGPGRNGVFTSNLLSHMETPGLKLEDAMKRTRVGVMRDTDKRQVPWESSSLTGEFYFVPPGAGAAGGSSATTPGPSYPRPTPSTETPATSAGHQPYQVASLPPQTIEPGIIYDSKTGLEWYVGPDRRTSWWDAKSWVSQLTIGGGGWRMPTKEELAGLYRKGTGSNNMDPAFKTSGSFVWSGERISPTEAWGFDFRAGFPSRWRAFIYAFDSGTIAEECRGFAVRSRK
ncbi:MAG: caspase family protein [Thermodesulfobacteriota bacterium]